MERRQAFLLVLAASFLVLLIYLTAIPKKTSDEEFSLKAFARDVEIKKYCKTCRKYQLHKETSKLK